MLIHFSFTTITIRPKMKSGEVAIHRWPTCHGDKLKQRRKKNFSRYIHFSSAFPLRGGRRDLCARHQQLDRTETPALAPAVFPISIKSHSIRNRKQQSCNNPRPPPPPTSLFSSHFYVHSQLRELFLLLRYTPCGSSLLRLHRMRKWLFLFHR